jgi:hypothetical protein
VNNQPMKTYLNSQYHMALPLARTVGVLRQLYRSVTDGTTSRAGGSLFNCDRDGLIASFHVAVFGGCLGG